MSREDIRCNIASTIRELEFKNYPKSWWRGHLFMAVERSGQLLGAQVACLLQPKVAYHAKKGTLNIPKSTHTKC